MYFCCFKFKSEGYEKENAAAVRYGLREHDDS